ncbi:MAG: NAD(P)/FAD-dependent oxidoreductase, partial [Sphingomonadales bacterium]
LANIDVVTGAEIDELEGSNGALEAIWWADRTGGQRTRREVCQLFLFVGPEPNTDWLRQLGLEVDARGFVQTGSDCTRGRLPLETSRPGVFAIGDVRSGSVKRIAAAVGDGAQVVATLNQYLARKKSAAPLPGTPVPA